MTTKKYDAALVERVNKINDGLGPQVLAQLWAVNPDFRAKRVAAKLRRILSGKCHPGDAVEVERMEVAKAALMQARSTLGK
ncbi:MAG TPA: hypothetical protein PKJ19_13580 [Flavobacteriales bacterium]|nr:hypothetical protein [Flavobacteriales bacterium]